MENGDGDGVEQSCSQLKNDAAQFFQDKSSKLQWLAGNYRKRECFKGFVLSAVFSANPHSAWCEMSG